MFGWQYVWLRRNQFLFIFLTEIYLLEHSLRSEGKIRIMRRFVGTMSCTSWPTYCIYPFHHLTQQLSHVGEQFWLENFLPFLHNENMYIFRDSLHGERGDKFMYSSICADRFTYTYLFCYYCEKLKGHIVPYLFVCAGIWKLEYGIVSSAFEGFASSV